MRDTLFCMWVICFLNHLKSSSPSAISLNSASNATRRANAKKAWLCGHVKDALRMAASLSLLLLLPQPQLLPPLVVRRAGPVRREQGRLRIRRARGCV